MNHTPLHTLRALLLLTGPLLKRLLREGMVVRSLVFPAALVIGTNDRDFPSSGFEAFQP